jgi:hypothetical protein
MLRTSPLTRKPLGWVRGYRTPESVQEGARYLDFFLVGILLDEGGVAMV